MRVPYISLLAAGALALGGCAYGDLGVGYGSGYGGYGGYGGYSRYGSPYYGSSYGGYYGSPYGYSSYGSYGSPYGYGGYSSYGSPYYGWNNGYYYPGTGYYVYDSNRVPHTMSSGQRDYWTNRQKAYTTAVTTKTRRAPTLRQDWSAFKQQKATDRATRKAERTKRTRR